MDGFRQMLLSFCTACVMGAVIQGIAPEKAQRLGINLVLLLYILSTALNWQRHFQGSAFLRAADASAQPRDYTDIAEQMTREQVMQNLQSTLDVSVPGCTIRLTSDNILVLETEEFSKAAALLRSAGWQGEIREAQP